MARTKSGNVESGSNFSYAVPRITRCTAISAVGVSVYWISFRHSTDFPYRRVSTDTIFQCAINDSRPQCWALELTFSAAVHQMTLTTMVQSNVVPTFRWGAPITPKKGPIRYNIHDVTTVSSKMLCPSKAAQSILATNRTYSNEFTTKSSDKGVFRKFLTRMTGFNPNSRLGETLSQNHDMHVSSSSKSLLWVGASLNSLTQLIPTHKSRKCFWFRVTGSLRQARDVYNKFWTFLESTKKHKLLEFVTRQSDLAQNWPGDPTET